MRKPKETELERTVEKLLSRLPVATHFMALIRFKHHGKLATALAPLTSTELQNYEAHPNGISVVLPFGRCDQEPVLTQRVRQGIRFLPPQIAWDLACIRPRCEPDFLANIRRAGHQPS